ncbi:kinase-like protein [Pseudovirgaria hyperparasitica]|uniref:EKC/KEOPS complex subunit BUD32 n=1 Tax=Pseudovirgaria hyperparasitica TaxID=470096 RepID=A0A6A6W2M8_9PEZI|nr:kinase-like protein [Pseudovirgaria hyperparasitica]KAF2757102.1 kinase-like protein [Pseudovirgaria hyperparasitica]
MQQCDIQWPRGLGGGDLVGAGTTAIVARLDAVIKFCQPWDSHFLDREKLVYERLGHDHQGIVRYFGVLDNAIVLQFARETSIRQYIGRQTRIPLHLKLRWAEQIFDAVQYVHSRGVLHGDISCNNVFLDHNLNVKLGDFAGSSIDGCPPLVCYETSHELPGTDISAKTELFALGSTVYELMTGSKPYASVSDDQISAYFEASRFPDVTVIPALRNTILKCWSQDYETISEALQDIKLEVATDKLSIFRHIVLFKRKSLLVPLILTLTSILPFIGWAKRSSLLR